MGIGYEQFCGIGATMYFGQSASAKEGDSSWKNLRMRSNKGDWPSLVIQAGMSESLPRLRSNARWWIEHSDGRVNIVLLIWIRPAMKTVKIEKWERGQAPTTRTSARLNPSNAFPTQTAEITVQSNSNTVTGAPLILEFSKIFDHLPTPPAEHVCVITVADLANWASLLWIGL